MNWVIAQKESINRKAWGPPAPNCESQEGRTCASSLLESKALAQGLTHAGQVLTHTDGTKGEFLLQVYQGLPDISEENHFPKCVLRRWVFLKPQWFHETLTVKGVPRHNGWGMLPISCLCLQDAQIYQDIKSGS